MTLALDFPRSRASLLGAIDPRWKLASFALAAVLIGLLRDWRISLAALGGVALLVLLARPPLRWYALRIGGLTLFLLLFLAWPVFFPEEGDATIDLFGLPLAQESLFHLVGVLTRAAAMVSLVLIYLATTSLPDTFKAAHSLRVPGLLIQILMLTYRYLFLLGEEFRRLRTALRVRGFRNRANAHSYRTIGQVAGTMLVRSYDRAERVGHAMRCRGFDGQFRGMHEFRTRVRDVAFFAGVTAASAALALWQWLPLAA